MRRPAGDVILVESDLDAAPGVFVESFGACNDEVCTECGSGEAGCTFGQVALDGPDTS